MLFRFPQQMYLYFPLLFCAVCSVANNYVFFPCRTPNDELAFCVSLFSCPILMKALGTLEPNSIDFVQKSICRSCNPNDPNDVMVCCGTLSAFQNTSKETAITETPQQAHRNYVKNKLLPSRKYCGFQQTDDRYYDKNETALDEFPWLTHVVFLEDDDDDPYQYDDRCNGVLISKRYVLTSEYCGTYAKRVRLGQYNSNKTVECVDNPYAPECGQPWLEVLIEEELHRIKSTGIWHDFTLLRLAKTISYTDFIRPICLPLDDSIRLMKRDSLILSGWGALGQDGVVKKRITYNITNDVEKCYELDEHQLKEAAANISVICLVPQTKNGTLVCGGDEAGPLTYSYKYQWFVEGIITRVYSNDEPTYCSNRLPIAGVRITEEILNWIMDNMRA